MTAAFCLPVLPAAPDIPSMSESHINVVGAREHNLKNVSVRIPREKLVVITGVSGSGKSSLAFDTIYAEGQRRYVESLSAYARQFLGLMEKPDVDHIEGLSPAISIDQKGVSRNPRSTVGTVTEIYDYLRLLFSRAGRPHCPNCGRPVQRQTVQQIVDAILRMPEGTRLMLLAPVVTHMKGEHVAVFEDARRDGFVRVRVDGEVRDLSEPVKLDKQKWHDIEIVVDRVIVRKDTDTLRLTDSVETALKRANGTVVAALVPREDAGGQEAATRKAAKATATRAARGQKARTLSANDVVFSEKFACVSCGISISELEPRNFSFNTPFGACPTCTGLGFRLEVDPDLAVPDKNLSIKQGGIAPWASAGASSPWYVSTLEGLARARGFSLDTPIKDLDPEDIHVLLYGTDGRKVEVVHRTQKGKVYRWNTEFEGVVPSLERRFSETESESVREDIERYMAQRPCATCKGLRLKPEALAVTVLGMSIMDVTQQPVEKAVQWVNACKTGAWPGGAPADEPLSEREQVIARQILKEIDARLGFLSRVGLDYLTLDRAASTLSGGEGQRIRLATQIGSGLMGVLYVCDEPSVGLHPADNSRLIDTLKSLRDVGNSVLIVEHDEAVMRAADYIIDLGPGAGEHGGRIVAEGPLQTILDSRDSVTGAYLSGRREIPLPEERRPGNGLEITVRGARANNLAGVDVKFPLGRLVCVTGVSGSGKSTLVTEVLLKRLAQVFYRAKDRPGDHDAVLGLQHIDKVINIDQSPIGRTPRSNPATYTDAFTPIRNLYATMPEAKARGYDPGRFSFNVKGGRCESCAGAGYVQIEMQFLPDVTVPCEVCRGARYNREALEIKFKTKSISEVLDMTVSEAADLFENIPALRNRLQTLKSVGLGYIRLGQPATTLSGGEAQRIKLAGELARRSTGRTLYILDEPTTGLSFDDCAKLMEVLHKLVDAGNTVVLIEHHLDLIKNADWIIDLGPGAGERGGRLVAEGTPEFIASVESSATGQYLREVPGIVPDAAAPGTVGDASASGNGRRKAAVVSSVLPKRPEDLPAARAPTVSANGTAESHRGSRWRRSRSRR
jgi:excinuclease ABC subunit A